jgi:hypothetical protein
MNKASKYLLIIILVLTYCSTNQKIVIDNRYKITKAPKWKTEFASADSGSGLIIQLNKDKKALLPDKIELLLWVYPLDTIITEQNFYNVIQPMPGGGIADERYIDYKINNDPVLIPIKVDSTNRFYISIQPDTFYLSINSFYVTPNYLKDIIVKQGYWSIITLLMYEPPVNLY